MVLCQECVHRHCRKKLRKLYSEDYKKMTLLEKFLDGVNNKNEANLNETLHDDYKFAFHAYDKSLSKSEVIKLIMGDSYTNYKQRIIYENDEIGIDHVFVTFSSGDAPEAVLSVHIIKNGKIISAETGATPVPKFFP